MIRLFLIGVLSIFSGVCKAQLTLTTVGVETLYRFKIDTDLNDTFQNVRNKGVSFMPTIGVFHAKGNGIGFGIKMGFGMLSSDYEVTRNEGGISLFSALREKEYRVFVCPAIFEHWTKGRYIIITSLNLPTYLRLPQEYVYEEKGVQLLTGQGIYQGVAEVKRTKVVEIGICIEGCVQRQIFRRFYGGGFVNTGYFTSYGLGAETTTIRETDFVLSKTSQSTTDYPSNSTGKLDLRWGLIVSYKLR